MCTPQNFRCLWLNDTPLPLTILSLHVKTGISQKIQGGEMSLIYILCGSYTTINYASVGWMSFYLGMAMSHYGIVFPIHTCNTGIFPVVMFSGRYPWHPHNLCFFLKTIPHTRTWPKPVERVLAISKTPDCYVGRCAHLPILSQYNFTSLQNARLSLHREHDVCDTWMKVMVTFVVIRASTVNSSDAHR